MIEVSDKPIAERFNATSHSFDDITVIIIEQIYVADSA